MGERKIQQHNRRLEETAERGQEKQGLGKTRNFEV